MVVIAAAADGKGPVAPSQWAAGVPHLLANLLTQRGTAAWGNKSALPSSNAWGSPWLPDHKNDGASASPSRMDDRPSSPGSSTSSSTIGSDFLDLPSYRLPTAATRPPSTETRAGSLQLSRFQDSFTNVLKAPSTTVGRRASTSKGKGFSLSLDDFPELGSKNSASNCQQGQNSGRLPTINSGMATQAEQGKNPITGTGEVISSCSYEHESVCGMDYMLKGGDPIPAAKLTRGAEQAQLHGPKGPNICMPPPWLDYWHPPPDQPPDENGILHKGEPLYGPYKNADPIGFPVESLDHFGQSTLNKEAAARQHTGHGEHFPDNRDPSHPHLSADCCVINQPFHVLGKVKNSHTDVFEIEKQPIIKKDLALLEKIKCLNMKARKLRALSLSNPPSSLPKESKVEHPKSIHVESDHVTEYVPFSAATREIGPAFHNLNPVSESSNYVRTNPSNVLAKGVVVDRLLEEQVTEFSEPGKVSNSANCHAYERGDISRYGLDCSSQDIPSSGYGWEQYSVVDSLQGAVMTDAQQNQSFSDTKGAEAKSHEDLLTRNKNIRRDSDAIRPAAALVFGNEKNSKKVSVHKTAINGSMVPAKVNSVTGLIVGSIMLEDVSLASVNPEWAAAAKEVHYTATSLSRPQQVKNSEKNQHGQQPVVDSVSNDNVMCKLIKQTSKKEGHAEGGPNVMAIAGAIEPSGSHSIALENVATTKSSEIGWYAHEPLYEELQQKNREPVLTGENQTTSDCNRVNSNLKTKYHDKEAPASSTKVEVINELNGWLDRETTLDYRGRPHDLSKQKNDGLPPLMKNLAEPVDYFNVANVVEETSDQWQQRVEQFESKAHDDTVDHSKQTQMVPWPDNTLEKHQKTDSPRCYQVERQRNVGSRYGYKERAGRGHFFNESPAPSRLRWMPKYTFHPPSDAQDNGASEWLHDSTQILLNMDNSQGLDSQLAERDGVDLQCGDGNVSMSFVDENLMIWNETEWEYQQPFPAPHRLGQQHGGRGHGWYPGMGCYTDDDSQSGRGRHSEYYYVEPLRSHNAAPDIRWNLGGADNQSAGVNMERRYYI